MGLTRTGRHGRRRPLSIPGVLPGVLLVGGLACLGLAGAAGQPPATPPLSTVQALAPRAPSAPPPTAPVTGTAVPASGVRPSATAVEALPPAARTPAPAARGPVLAASAPVSVQIPALGVESPLLSLGLAPDGSLEVPPPGPHYDDAGWYRHSPAPGSLGPAVIAGHVDSAAGGPSVFFRLGSLAAQDLVSVTRADGSVATFAVDAVHRFRKSEFPTELVYGDTDHAALRLITCGGTFDRKSGHYLDNIVVTASLVSGTSAQQ